MWHLLCNMILKTGISNLSITKKVKENSLRQLVQILKLKNGALSIIIRKCEIQARTSRKHACNNVIIGGPIGYNHMIEHHHYPF